jgi:hypothetical protein
MERTSCTRVPSREEERMNPTSRTLSPGEIDALVAEFASAVRALARPVATDRAPRRRSVSRAVVARRVRAA